MRVFYNTPSPASDPSGVWSYTWWFSVDIRAAIRRFDGLPPSICTHTALVEFNYRRCEPRRSWKNNYCRVRKRFCHPLVVVPSPLTRSRDCFLPDPSEVVARRLSFSRTTVPRTAAEMTFGSSYERRGGKLMKLILFLIFLIVLWYNNMFVPSKTALVSEVESQLVALEGFGGGHIYTSIRWCRQYQKVSATIDSTRITISLSLLRRFLYVEKSYLAVFFVSTVIRYDHLCVFRIPRDSRHVTELCADRIRGFIMTEFDCASLLRLEMFQLL